MTRAAGIIRTLLLGAFVSTASVGCSARIYAGRDAQAYQDVQRRAYDTGRREGLDRGRDDALRRRSFAFNRHGEYRGADEGYRRGESDRGQYQQWFRQGFESGYADGYNRVPIAQPRREARPTVPPPVQGRSRNGASPAAVTGYRDGSDAGRRDARAGHPFDPIRTREYRSANHDYDRRFGPQESYRQEYRTAFERGYTDGYRASGRR